MRYVLAVIRSFRHKGLRDLFERGKTARIDARLRTRVLARLDALDQAARPEDMDVPGWDFHRL